MTEVISQPRRHWLSFSLRALLVLMTILCMFLGWIGPKWLEMKREEAAVKKTQAVGGQIIYDYQHEHAIYRRDHPEVFGSVPPDPYGPQVLRDLFGEHILSRVVEVRFAKFDASGGDPNQATAELPKLHHLKQVEFNRPVALTDDSIEQLKKIRSLRSIALGGNTITAGRVKRLSQESLLETIALSGTDATYHQIQQLKHFPHLKQIVLSSRQMSDRGFESLGSIATLESLSLRQTPGLSDIHVNSLLHLKHLTCFDMSYHIGSHSLTERSIPTLCEIETLEILCLQFENTPVEYDPQQYQDLTQLTQLRKLWLVGSNLKDASMETIGKLDNLNDLNLSQTQVSDTGLTHLRTLKQLRNLSIAYTSATDDSLRQLEELPELESLNLQGMPISEEGVESLLKIPELKILSLNKPISKASVQKLVGKNSLQQLTLWHQIDPQIDKCLRSAGFVSDPTAPEIYYRK